MTLAGALAALALILHLQMSFGQFNPRNAEPSRLSIHKQQETESPTVTKNVDNIVKIQKPTHTENLKSDIYYNLNKTKTKTGDGTINNVKFLRNQVYGIPATTFTVINRNSLGSQSIFGHPIGPPITSHFDSNVNHVGTATGETIIKQSENKSRSEAKSPLYVPFGAQPPVATSPQSLYLASAQPLLSSIQFVPNVDTLQTVAAPLQNQQTHQTLSSFLTRPSNVQGPVQYMRLVPADTSTQKTMDNIVQNHQSLTSLVLSHILSQSSNAQDSLSPIQIRSQSQDSKNIKNKTLLPLLLKLLNEKNNNDCKSERSDIHNGLKRGKLDEALEINSESDTSEVDDEEADYNSDESSDTDGEDYDDD